MKKKVKKVRSIGRDINGVIDEPGYPGYVRVRYSQQEGNLSQPTTLPFEANMIKQTR